MRFLAFIGAVILAAIAVASAGQDFGWIASLFIISTGAWLVFFSFGGLGKGKLPPGVVLELGGIRWSEEDFCRGWEIDGRTGSGKTASAVVPIIHQLKKNRPDVGILALDTKGDLGEPLARIADDLNCGDSFVQLEVRPEDAPSDWKPAVTMNCLADTTIPYSTYAKIIVDVATAAGQKGGQAFFKVAAQTAIQNTFSALAALGRPVTIPVCAEVIASPGKYEEMGKALLALSEGRPDVAPLVQYFHEFIKQPPEQLGGIRSTVFNYLQPFTAPDIAAVCRGSAEGRPQLRRSTRVCPSKSPKKDCQRNPVFLCTIRRSRNAEPMGHARHSARHLNHQQFDVVRDAESNNRRAYFRKNTLMAAEQP